MLIFSGEEQYSLLSPLALALVALVPARHKAFNPERVTKRSAVEVRKALVLRSVKDSSAEQYASARAVIGRSGMRRGSEISDELVLSCTEDEFLLFLGSREEQDAASAEVHRSALLQLHRAACKRPFLLREGEREACGEKVGGGGSCARWIRVPLPLPCWRTCRLS
jgi:hypothetical protein